jgi:hypothetical protein
MLVPVTTESEHWMRIAAVLSEMPHSMQKLSATHRPDEHGLCLACTTPGRGTPREKWPCSLAALVATARRLARSRHHAGVNGGPKLTP